MTMNDLTEQDKNLHHAIREDDVRQLEHLLSTVSPEDRINYVNGAHHQKMLSEKPADDEQFSPSCLIHLAAIHRAKYCLSALLFQGADATKVDSCGNNILHMMVYGAVAKPEIEEEFCIMLDHMQKLIDLNQIAFIEEVGGLRPLELAYNLGALHLAEKMFTIPGLYLVATEEKGIRKTQWFDITDYEGFGEGQGSRKIKSPLIHLTRISKAKLHEISENNGLQTTVLTSWIKHKISTYTFFYLVWLFIRALFVLAIIVYMKTLPSAIDQQIMNSTLALSTDMSCIYNSYFLLDAEEEDTLTWFMTGTAMLMVIFDLFEFVFYIVAKIKHKWMNRSLRPGEEFAVNLIIYRVMHFLLVLTISLLAFDSAMNDANVEAVMIVSTTLCLWSLFYLLELFPGIGRHIMTYQRLMGDMIYLIIMFLMFITPYSQLFQKIVTVDGYNVSCPAEYASIGDSFYSTFTIIVNMVNFRSFVKTDPTMLFVLHYIYVIIVGIMLLNFFIALLSESVASLGQVRKELSLLLRLNMALTIERRISWLFQWIITPMQRKRYAYTNGKIYLTIETVDIDHAPNIGK